MADEQVDYSELRRFTTDLERAADGIAPQVRGVMTKGALNIKNVLQADMKASRYFKGVASSITYETKVERDAIEVEIGPDKSKGDGEGGLANIAYFGGTGWGGSQSGGTVADPQLALDAESPVIERFLEEILGGAI